jgi:hypothetical protein
MKKEKGVVYFCHSCGDDIRSLNVDYHIALGHKVHWYKHDPRDKRYPDPEEIGSPQNENHKRISS